MVYNNIPYSSATHRIITKSNILSSATKTHMTNNDIMSIYQKGSTCYTNPITGSCLSGYSYIRSTKTDRRFQTNYSGYIKYNDTGTACFASFPKCSRTGIFQ